MHSPHCRKQSPFCVSAVCQHLDGGFMIMCCVAPARHRCARSVGGGCRQDEGAANKGESPAPYRLPCASGSNGRGKRCVWSTSVLNFACLPIRLGAAGRAAGKDRGPMPSTGQGGTLWPAHRICGGPAQAPRGPKWSNLSQGTARNQVKGALSCCAAHLCTAAKAPTGRYIVKFVCVINIVC